MFLTRKIIKFQLPSLLKKSKVKHGTVNYDKAERVGILVTFHDHEKQHTVDEFIDHLVADKKEVQVLCYDKRRARNKIFGYLQFTDKHISLFGKFKAEHVIDFINSDFDYLFHLDLESNEILDKVLALSQAKCRIGSDMEAHRSFYELMIKSDTVTQLSKLMLHYAKVVNVNEEQV
ncbi:DUF6913 domain-containing protein [Porifericola rhodea]|uniref:DUF6913 domain-containing protein n=1 Tax=Porifericola rhodea TaxID=930972 RepID=UPI003F541704